MGQQLRLRVIVPVAVLGLLGAAFGAFAYGKPPQAATSSLTTPQTPATAKPAKAKPAKKPAAARKARPSTAPERSALERALGRDRAVVVVFYTPQGGVDNVAIREARAGALAVDAGFLSVNVKRNGEVEELAEEFGVTSSPAVLVFVRGPKVASQFGYADRETVSQAVADALR